MGNRISVIATSKEIEDAFYFNPHSIELSLVYDALMRKVEKGDAIVRIEDIKTAALLANLQTLPELKSVHGRVFVVAPNSGYFIPCYSIVNGTSLSKKELKECLLGYLFDNIDDAICYIMGDCQSFIKEDPFTKEKDVFFKWSGILQNEGKFQIGTSLYIELCFEKDSFVISFTTKADAFFDGEKLQVQNSNEAKIRHNDTISLLFDDGSIIDFSTNKCNHDLQFSCTLYQEDLAVLSAKKVSMIRITFAKEGVSPLTEKKTNYVFGDFSNVALQYYIKQCLVCFQDNFPNYHFPSRILNREEKQISFDWCYVYLMKDTTNGYYKIGISNKPEYREKTLQSEKPTIELLTCKKYPTRKIAEAIESALHSAYSQQRIRGEWFKLDDVDVAVVIETLK